jgi:uncharacterized protein YdeI (YjbR/CyaY-like superfamily)
MTKPRFFATRESWRAWLDKNHATATELVVGFHKKATGKPSITHKQALDEALCYGWIDGRAGGGETSWTIRFTPRRPRSIWSDINIKRVSELKALGKMHPAGIKVFESRDPARQKQYSSENRQVTLDPAYQKKFRANKKAWEHFQSRPRSYRHPATWWVMSAKKEETREKRLATLIEDSAAGRKIKPLRRPGEA